MAHFVPTPGLAKTLSGTPEMMHACLDVAEKVVEKAQAMALTEAYRTGAYMNGIIAAVGEGETGPVAQVQGTDYKSRWLEFGFVSQGVTHAPKAIIRRAAEALGYSTVVRHK